MKDPRLINLLEMPYINNYSSHIEKYELFDASTKEFMSKFKKDIQNVNNGQLTPKKFKRTVGTSNFNLYAQAAYLCIRW
ncbi:MAG: hypothetical protein IJH39_06605 [Clostridia bacterium]|nr:hypothetical protein [Clostridia bacterium]